MKKAVLLLADGSPDSIDDVEAYLTDIHGGPPDPAAIEDLTSRFIKIGGPSSLTEMTRMQASSLEQVLDTEANDEFDVYVGMKHWHPYIADAVADIINDGTRSVLGLILNPFHSPFIAGAYEERILAAATEAETDLELKMIGSWFDEPDFVQFVASNIQESLHGWGDDDFPPRVFFTARALPARLIEQGDTYPGQVEACAGSIAKAAGIAEWEIAWHSPVDGGEPIVEPDVNDRMQEFADEGGTKALIAPVGFVCDHIEVLHDIDIELVAAGQKAGVDVRRITTPNDNSRFIRALTNVVLREAGKSVPSRT